MRPLVVACVAAIAALSSCHRKTVKLTPPPVAANTMHPGTFIDSPGSRQFTDRSGTYKLDVTRSGETVSWDISISQHLSDGGTSGGTAGGGMTVDPDRSWFIYMEEPGRYWMCDGKQRLDYYFKDEHGGNSGPAVDGDKVMPESPRVPAELIPRLPPEMRKLFPDIQPPRKRPSI